MSKQDLHQILINIAGFTVSLETDNDSVAESICKRYADFLDNDQTAHARIRLEVIPGALFIEPLPGPWIIESTYTAKKFTYRSYLEQGEVNLQTMEGVVEMAPQTDVENFLRTLYAWFCVKNDSILLHAAGVIRNGEGYVFFGPSGAGKTTTTYLAAKQGHILSDDLVIIRKHKGQYHLYGVPFKGELSDAPRSNKHAPLKGIFRLRQDDSHYLEPLSTTTAIAELVASAPFVVRELSLSPDLISVCTDLARSTTVQQLHFKRDDGFWEVIDGYFANVPATASANGR